jgi:peptide/nickel transport system substrate-binding protein
MQRRILLIVAAAAAVLGLAASAGAMTMSSGSATRVLAAAPFSLKDVPRSPAVRAAHSTLNFAQEQQIDGFNALDANTTQLWAIIVGGTPSIRGAYIVDNKGKWHLDLAKSVVATKKSLTIKIRPDAYWYWQGHPKAPVTAADFVYTWQQIMLKGNDSASTSGYSQITRAKVLNKKTVRFFWKPAYADYKDLFGFILPKAAFSGISGGFNAAWTNCICGSDGKPVSDGPYYLSKFSYGTGAQLKANPVWYGSKPHIKTINWIVYTQQNSEEQAYNAHEVDAMYPGAATTLAQYIHQAGTKFSSVPGFGQEHLDINTSGKSLDNQYNPNPLLKHAWMRQAIMEGINRKAIIRAIFTGLPAPPVLDNPTFFPVGADKKWATGKYAYQHKYNFNGKKAIATLKKHGCTGGPSKPDPNTNAVWTCGGVKASFGYFTTTRQARVTTSQIVQAQLKAIGIEITPHIQSAGTFFGSTTVNQDYDLGEYAWSGSPDPAPFDGIYQCVNAAKNLGGQNWKGYCDPKVDKLMTKGDSDLKGTTHRYGLYEQAAKRISNAVPVIAYYGPPSILIYRTTYKLGPANNSTSTGPTWNIEDWK